MDSYPEGLSRTDPAVNRAGKHRRGHHETAPAELVFDEHGQAGAARYHSDRADARHPADNARRCAGYRTGVVVSQQSPL